MSLPLPSRAPARFLALALVLSLVSLTWWLWPEPEPSKAKRAAPVEADSVSAINLAPDSSAVASAAVRTHDVLPPGLTVSVLQERADKGDVQAAFDLGRLLLGCLHYQPVDVEALEEELIDAAATDHPFLHLFTGQSDSVRAVQLVLDIHGDQASRCSHRGLPAREDRAQLGLAALEQAATAGHAGAQLAWVLAFRLRWADGKEVVRSGERVRIERERARSYLSQSLAARLPEALLAQSIAHRTGDLAARDSVRALAYWRAWRQLGSPGSPAPAWLVDQVDANSANRVAAEDSRAADALARQLVGEFKQ
jgi:hypothetical protein